MPNLLRFCFFSMLIAGLAFNTNAQRHALRRAASPTVGEQKTITIQNSIMKDTARATFSITANKLKQINRIRETVPEKSFSRDDLIRSQRELTNWEVSKQDTGIKEVQLNYEESAASGPGSKKRSRPDCRETNAVNKDKVTDAYPFISADGLRLYFTSNREGGHGRFFISKRNSVKDPFGEPAVLSKNLTDGYYAGTFTADELTLCMAKSGKIYISRRKDWQSEFDVPVQVKGIADNYHYGPAISPDGNEIIVMSSFSSDSKYGYDIAEVYKKISEVSFREAGILFTAKGSDPGPGQFSKDGLSYYFSFETHPDKEVSIWRYTRKSITDNFVDLEELPVRINGFQRNFQPSVNADASIIVYTTSQNDVWEEDDIVLVNDPHQALSAPEQFTSVLKNDSRTLTVMGKVTTPEMKAFPNPFQNDIIFEMSESPADGTIFTLYDLNGRMIKQQRITNRRTTIQLGGLPSATYIYQVLDDKKKLISSGKLVKAS